MDAAVVNGDSNLGSQDEMEFDSKEAAYEYYKEYAKSVGFGTAKLSSRRSRASKEFIDAKFSCIRYGNKQQSDDAINPRPSPKIGCKASLHVKRRRNGKWYIHSFVKEHNHELLPAQAHFFRSHRNADPLQNDAKARRRKILTADEWMKLLYEDRQLWVPTFTKGISFAGLSSASRAESLNSFFDKYINVETSLKDFVEQYKVVLEDRYEEQAKGDFDAWHEPPELKSPSPFEKQLSLVYTHEIFKKFQVEVLGAAACHLKKEREYEGTKSYAVKEFEDNQEFMVEWNESKAEICCSCRSLEYKGYLCRHAIVVLQMSGVFCIPHKYILQRWTNAATSKCCITENFDDVQSKVRRFNDLCRRAIILGEEGSLSQESYTIALGAIKEALKQCSDANTSVNSELRSNTSVPLAVPHMEEDDHVSPRIPADPAPVTKVNRTYKASKRSDCGKEKANTDGSTNGKRKVPLESEVAAVGFQGSFHQMELPHTRPRQLHEVLPPNLHNGVPEIFQNVASSRYQHVDSANVQDGHLPDVDHRIVHEAASGTWIGTNVKALLQCTARGRGKMILGCNDQAR
ncbi:hypothetical protein POM88_003521 [Heracleum sosnowskyi]|uniref:Protein FAR1-RELATED SEQUENCE n=1 Tax=Heracleum sosnowskyi TaxID=360622 RepID=A0AAD8JJS2_9APIA|nr:hypothetical protein POM88_003521 [Heracleum sosnowskyi]